MTRPYDISEISRMLADNVDRLVRDLLPGGRKHGHEWVEASTRDGGRGDSLRVHLSGDKKGVWSHFSRGEGGDALDLVAYLNESNKSDAVKWARTWLGLDVADPETVARMHRAAKQRQEKAQRGAAVEDEKQRKRAQALFLSAEPRLKGTPVDLYLKSRGIDLAQLGRQPASLRYHPKCYCREIDAPLPAMVAAICGPDGRTISVHRTYLAVDGDRVTKARLQSAKKVYGAYRGGAIRLWRGESVDAKTGEIRALPLARAPAGSELLLCEGIEDGLSLALACPEMRILVSVSLANMASIELPAAISSVILVSDNDPEFLPPDGSGARRRHPARVGLERAINTHLAAGRDVKLARPPAGAKDMNELLNQQDGVA